MQASRALQWGSRSLWTNSLVAFGAFVLLVGAPIQGRAQGVCSDPANRTLNCDFATDISGWVPEIGSSFTHSPDGNVGPGSIEVQSEPVPDDLIKINQCVGGLAGLSTIDFGASFLAVAGPHNGCGVEAYRYADDNCTSFMGGGGTYTAISTSSWTRIGGTFDLDPAIRGIRISAICFSFGGMVTVRIDDIYLGVGVGAIIFNDGFESSDTSAWGSTTS